MNIAENTTGLPARQKVIYSLLLAFLIRVLATMPPDLNKTKARDVWLTIVGTGIVAWSVVTFALTLAADFDTTQDIAVAFSFLVLVAVFMTNGLDAFDFLQRLYDFHFQPQTTNTQSGTPSSPDIGAYT